MLRCAIYSSELFNTIPSYNGFLINSVFAFFANVFYSCEGNFGGSLEESADCCTKTKSWKNFDHWNGFRIRK